jgi:glycosyltransferase involved in cell wall biosynthesis
MPQTALGTAYSILDTPDRTCLRIDTGAQRGTAIIAISREAARAGDDARLMFAHSIFWESREIYLSFLDLGFDVDVIDLGAPAPAGAGPYQASLTFHFQLLMVEAVLAPGAIRITWLTASHAPIRNAREIKRIRALEQRRDCQYEPKRQVAHVDAELEAIERADHCILIGNAVTLGTYPKRWHKKIEPFAVSAANIRHVKPPAAYIPTPREFIWYSASGAVMKGLDLLLDLFASRQLPTLHVVGALDGEQDFLNVYHSELDGHTRIRMHGFLHGDDPKLAEIFDRCIAVVHPSADEGMAGSVAHCLRVGLFPVISRVTGLDLPPGCGRYIEDCTIEEIEVAVGDVLEMPETDLRNQIGTMQAMAHERFSRESYGRRLREVFGRWLA